MLGLGSVPDKEHAVTLVTEPAIATLQREVGLVGCHHYISTLGGFEYLHPA